MVPTESQCKTTLIMIQAGQNGENGHVEDQE